MKEYKSGTVRASRAAEKVKLQKVYDIACETFAEWKNWPAAQGDT